MAAKLIEVFNNCKCVGEEQHLAAGEVRSLAFGDNRSVMVIELGLHEVVKRGTLAKPKYPVLRAYQYGPELLTSYRESNSSAR